MAAEKKHKLTPAQRLMLSGLAEGRPWDWHVSGRSAYGGAQGTVYKLRNLGYMVNFDITDAGRIALQNA
jgi:hypothetical protein